MKKILFVARLDEHIRHFHLPYLKWFKDNGYQIDIASDGREDIPYIDNHYVISMERSPLKIENYRSYKELKKLIEKNEYDIVHCHMPISGLLARFASRKQRKKGLKVLYTAHGFHFFKGAPLLNWLVYFPAEKLASLYTDCIITINNEDFLAAKNKLNVKRSELVNGVGVNIDKFNVISTKKKNNLRTKLGYKEEDYILIYVAELSHRKHQDLLIETVNEIKNEIPNVKLLLVGQGVKQDTYQQMINELGLQNNVNLLGYRNDVDKLMNIADIAVSSSRQEGLPVNVMEAMACGLPVVATNCRGNRDLVVNGKTGYIVNDNTVEEMAEYILDLYHNSSKRQMMGKNARELVQKYSLESVLNEMINIYKKYL